MIKLIILVSIFFISCDESGNEALAGCLDQTACNFNENATVDNGSCIYPESNFNCDGDCLVDVDCNNECGGIAQLDECGVCGGDGLEDNFDCDGNCLVDVDCNGDCGGEAVLDECGVCGGDGIADGACDCNGNVEDCTGECGGSALIDYCGVCMGSCEEGFADSCDELDCFGECYGDASVDDCGICGGDSSSCTDDDIFYLGSLNGNVLEILYSSSYDIAGFQFGISGADLISSSGGDAEANGFTVTLGNIALGISFDGSVIPSGEGILTNLEINIQNDVSEICITDLFVTSLDAQLPFQSGDCLSISR